MEKRILESLQRSIEAKQKLVAAQMNDIIRLVGLITETYRDGGKLLLFGNGGSAADAQHLAAEFVNRFLFNRPPLPAIALTTDTSVITSIGNDFSFEEIFARQLQALGQSGDIAIGISTSGNSPNVVLAFEAAADMGIKTVLLTGGHGGRLKNIADLTLIVPATSTPAIQEAHLWFGHLLCQLVEESLFGSRKIE